MSGWEVGWCKTSIPLIEVLGGGGKLEGVTARGEGEDFADPSSGLVHDLDLCDRGIETELNECELV